MHLHDVYGEEPSATIYCIEKTKIKRGRELTNFKKALNDKSPKVLELPKYV